MENRQERQFEAPKFNSRVTVNPIKGIPPQAETELDQ